MSERETRDFMSVEAFSQLPFIRPAPTKEKNSPSGIRLFGIEVPHETDHHEDDSSSSSSKDNNRSDTAGTGDKSSNASNVNASTVTGRAVATASESSRKFECHYCCRNFPTSQALGGHQNAHKRERQHAKRAHLQSALAAAHHHHPAIAEGHLYGLVNYHRVGPLSSSPRFAIGHAFDSLPTSHYPSWSSDTGTTAGSNYSAPPFYGGPGSVSQPINGSPLPGLWRVSPVQGRENQIPLHRDRSMALPLFGGGGNGVGNAVSNGITGPSSSLSPTSQSRILYEPKAAGVKDNLSLDLHL